MQTGSTAGGNSWRVNIEKMQVQSSVRATVVLQALEDGQWHQQCPKLWVEIDYQPNHLRRIEKLALERQDTALKKHQEALQFLQTAYTQQSETRFGEMVGGLILKQTQPSWLDFFMQFFSHFYGEVDASFTDPSISSSCQFKAQGLALLEESENQRVVYVLNEV